jgi:threonine dehydrogenase-like Zn-dependent dehydrogenase
MKAAVVVRPGKLEIKDVPLPVLGDNDILIKVHTASICNATDVHIYEGTFESHHDFYPQILGHEVCGPVIAKGSKVTEVKLGERLVFYTMNGAFCEYTKVDASWAWARLPENIPDRVAPLCEMFHGALIQSVYPAPMKPGEKILVIGVGPMGLVTLQSIKSIAEVTVGAIDFVDFRLEKAKTLGADFIFNRSSYKSQSLIKKIHDEMGEIDLVHVCTSVDLSMEQDLYEFAIQVLKPFGRLTGLNVEVKGLTHNIRVFPLFRKNILLSRSLNLNAYPDDYKERGAGYRKVIQMGVDWVSQGKVNLDRLITHQISLEEIETGLSLCRNHPEKTIKVVIKIDKSKS